MAKEKVVLLYSGGLDTSVILKWLADEGYEVHAYTADVGQREDWSKLEAKAKASGAVSFRFDDLREEFARDFIFPAVAFGARYEGRYLLGTSLARPLIAQGALNHCRRIGATIFAHGATGKGNDQVRFELAAACLAPELKVIAPWRNPVYRARFPGRTQMIEYAQKSGIPVKATASQPWSSDENLMHISFEAGMLEDPARTPEDRMFEYTRSPEQAPDKPAVVEIGFEGGSPCSVDGVKLPPHELVLRLNALAGEHGVGRVDIVESRFVGMKSRGVYETPGGFVLHEAYRDLETLVQDRGVLELKDSLMPRFARLIYNGFWFAPECRLLLKLLADTRRIVTGKVKLKLYKGGVISLGRSSPASLYDADIASMEADSGTYNQDDATGFIRLNALPLRTAALRDRKLQSGPQR